MRQSKGGQIHSAPSWQIAQNMRYGSPKRRMQNWNGPINHTDVRTYIVDSSVIKRYIT